MVQAATRSRTAAKEEAQPYLNKWGPWRFAGDPITETVVTRYCEVAQDGNPVYWDDEFAKSTAFGRRIAPPQAVMAFTFGPWWIPDHVTERIEKQAAELNGKGAEITGREVGSILSKYGYTVATVVNAETEYLEPFGPGDGRLKTRAMTIDVSEEKQTRPGKGVFSTTVTEYFTEHGDKPIARTTMALLMYDGSTPRESK